MNFNEREKTLDLFRILMIRIYNIEISKWLFESWKLAEPWHFELADYLKIHSIKNSFKILKLALILHPLEITVFVNYATEFTKMASCGVILAYIEGEKKCEKLGLEEFTSLATILMQDRNTSVIEACKAELMKTPLCDWVGLLEKTASTIHLSDKGSTQEAVNEFIQAYEPVDMPFC